MPISLPTLLASPGLGLANVGSAPVPDVPVGWVAVTEVEDPHPFLTGGEMVLTTGVRHTTAVVQRRFAARVHEAGAVAIGFGLGLGHDQVPPALLRKADTLGLPVFEVPYETPFIAIGKLVADALSAEHLARLESLLRNHGLLAAALLSGRGLPQLLQELSRILGADVELSQYGAQVAAATRPADHLEQRLWQRFPVATGLQDRCTLAISEPYHAAEIVDYAQSLISVELSNQARRRSSDRMVVGQLLADVVSGSLAGPNAVARLASAGINAETKQSVLMVDVASGQRRALATLPAPSAFDTAATALVDGRLLFVTPESDGGATAGALAEFLHGAGFTARVAYGGAYAHPSGLRWSYYEAREALNRGKPVNHPDRLSLTSLLMVSDDVPLLDLAEETLGPLVAFDRTHDAQLIRTLTSFLSLNGSVAAVADELGLHRNTVRYRLQHIVDLTGFDPAITADRVHLYLAVNARALR